MINWFSIKKALVYAIITEIAVFLIVKIVFDPTNPPDNRYFMYLSFFIAALFLGFGYSYRFRDASFFWLSLVVAFYMFAFMIQPQVPRWEKVYPTQGNAITGEEPTEEPYWTIITETQLQDMYYMVLLSMFGYYLFFYWLVEREKDRQELNECLYGRRKI